MTNNFCDSLELDQDSCLKDFWRDGKINSRKHKVTCLSENRMYILCVLRQNASDVQAETVWYIELTNC